MKYTPREPLNCPNCGVSLLGDKVPDEDQDMFKTTHFKREIGVYDIDLDMTVKYKCPDCDAYWDKAGNLFKWVNGQ